MKKWLKVITASLALISISSFCWLSFSSYYNYAAPAEAALSSLKSYPALRVTQEKYLAIQPANSTPSRGIILYPGAYCDIRGYAPILLELAKQNIAVIVVDMPFRLAIFSPDAAADVIQAYPNIHNWLLVGHSVGGAMASRFAALNPDLLDGLILWDSHPPASNTLADSNLPLMHIHRATTAGVIPDKFNEARYLFPSSSEWISIAGGQHMYFGAFEKGGYQEDWPPSITRKEQHKLVLAAMNKAIQTMYKPGQ